MDFNLKNEGTEFVFPGQGEIPDAQKASVVIRALTSDKVREIMKLAVTHKVESRPSTGRHGRPVTVEWDDLNNDILYEKSWDYVIVSWKNIEIDNTPVECTLENKLLLIGKDVFFADCIVTWRDDLEKQLEERIQASQKN